MRIGFLSVFNFGTNIGGVENHIYFMAHALQAQGHELIVLQPIESDTKEVTTQTVSGIEIRYIGIPRYRLFHFLSKFNGVRVIGFATAFLNKARFLLHSRRISKAVLRARPDIVHQHDFVSNIRTTKILAKRVPCMLTNHTGEYLYLRLSYPGRRLLRWMLKHFRYVIGPSIELTPKALHPHCATVHNGVDLSMFSPASNIAELRQARGLAADDFVVLCPRRWAPTKGVLYLMKAIRRGQFDRRYKFLFAGSDYDGYPRYKEEVRWAQRQVADSSQVILLGNVPVDEMVAYYQLADLTVIPSLMEAVSLAAIESMACGTPVLSTNVGGLPELIADGVNGIMVPPRNPAALARAIQRLSTDRILYERIVRGSLDTASRYSWTAIARRTEGIYKEVLKNSNRG
ncbi:MAG: glycosyltransferase family 4 protein [candidate division Zixibacteria bacterium]|nr:glycosyltransferase family 4 protein [candidate division Zixibacteria bacterium]